MKSAEEVLNLIKEKYIDKSKYKNIVYLGIEKNPHSNLEGVLVTVTTGDPDLRKEAFAALSSLLPATYFSKNIRIREADAVVLY